MPSWGNIPELDGKATGCSCMPRLCWLALIKRLLMEPMSGLPSILGLAKELGWLGTDVLLVGVVVVCMDTTFRTEEPEAKLEPDPDVRWLVSELMVDVPAAGAGAPPTLWDNRGPCSKYMTPDLDLLMMLGTVR